MYEDDAPQHESSHGHSGKRYESLSALSNPDKYHQI